LSAGHIISKNHINQLFKIAVEYVSSAIMAMVVLILPCSAAGNEMTASEQQNGIDITIYNSDLALVRENRTVLLDRGVDKLTWSGVAAQVLAETAVLRDLSHPNQLRLQEQNFVYDKLTPAKLLEKSLGKEITVVHTNPVTGLEVREVAIVLSVSDGLVLKFEDRIETGVTGRLIFSEIPNDLHTKPTFLFSLNDDLTGQHYLELSYLTRGLSWQADYVAVLNDADDFIDLNGLATVTNHSGLDYPKVNLQLVAGEVHRVQSAVTTSRKMLKMAASAEMADIAQVTNESLLEYHLYHIPHAIALYENQTKQISFLAARAIPVIKEYRLDGEGAGFSNIVNSTPQKQKVNIRLSFQNQGGDLGVPLPRGTVRIYKKDSQGQRLFAGEDWIEHISEKQFVTLKLGQAFDIETEKLQIDFKQVNQDALHGNIIEAAYRIVLKNAKKEAIVVQVQEPIPGDWEVLSESLPHKKLTAGLIEWRVSVAAGGAAELTYRVRVRY